MKKSTLIILSFIIFAIILTGIYAKLTKKYTKEIHNIDLYEGFVIRQDSVNKGIIVSFKTNPSGYITLFTPDNIYYSIKNYNKFSLFNPDKNNSVPVKFHNLKFKVIEGKRTEYFLNEPIDTVPPYLQKTGYIIAKALFIESAINIRYQNDTIIIEKANNSRRNYYTLLFENVRFNTEFILNGKDTTFCLTGLWTEDIGAFSEIKGNNLPAINKNMKTLTLAKPNGDIIETYHSLTLKNFRDNYLIANWYINRENMEKFRRLRIK